MSETIFPDLDSDIVVEDLESEIEYGKEISLTLVNGEPVVCEGVEALKIWIEKAIRTARYRWPIYSWDYGTELEDIIGLTLLAQVAEKEIERVVRETLLVDDRVEDVQEFSSTIEGDELTVEFTVLTFDDQELEVIIDV